MFKINQASSPVTNVIAGQNAIHRLNPGPRYHQVRYIITATNTQANASAAYPTLAQVLGVIQTKVNTKTVREATASQIDKIQTDWSASLATKVVQDVANDLVTSAPVVTTGGVNTSKTATFIFTLHFAEPSRDSYKARQAFALPTSWQNAAGQTNFTANVEVWLGVNACTGVANTTVGLQGVVIRAEETIDTVPGQYAKKLANGQPDTSSKPVLPMTHWYRQPEIYTSTKLQIRDWPFTGILQQLTVFASGVSAGGSSNGDNVTHALIKADGAVKLDQDAPMIDALCMDYGWNYGNFSAGAKHLAMDFDDDPTSAFPFNAYNTVELTLTLAQATASSSLEIISQVWRDALAS